MTTLFADIRYAFRMLRKQPGTTASALISLSFGIGITTAIFSVVNTVLLRPLPYGAPDGLMMVWERKFGTPTDRNVVNPGNYLDWKARSTSFTDLAGFTWSGATLTGEHPERVQGRKVTSNFFRVLGVSPVLGRTFSAEESVEGGSRVVVLSDELWRRRFAADPSLVGKPIALAGGSATVLGVMPRSFRPLPWGDEEYWEPFPLGVSEAARHGRFIQVIGRLRRGVSLAQAQTEMDGIAGTLATEFPAFNTGWGANVVPLSEQVAGASRRPLLVLFGAVTLVLLIACANIANLMLGRAASRRQELAVRAALGASRWRLARQWLLEGLLLACIGGAAGVLLAAWGVDLLVAAAPPDIPRLTELGVDDRVLTVALLLSVGAGVLFSLPVLFLIGARPVAESLREGSRTTAGSRSHRFRRGLVVIQVALALVLLFGAGLLIRSLQRLAAVDPGFDPRNLLTAQINLPEASYRDDAAQVAFFTRLLERLRATPGFREAGVSSYLPFGGGGAATSYSVVGRPEPPAGQSPTADIRVVDAGFFGAMHIPLRQGRGVAETDGAHAPPVVVISQMLARKIWPGENPVGKRVRVNWGDEKATPEVVGVVGDVPRSSLDEEIRPMIYYPIGQSPFGGGMMLVVRTPVEPTAAAATALSATLHDLDPDLPVSDVATMYARLTASMADRRYPMLLLGIFAALALTLAAVGLYGVLTFTVGERLRELGVRMALGARPGDVLRLVIRGGLSLTAIGLLVGTAVAAALARVLGRLLYDVPPTDPLTYFAVALLLLGVALTACYLPARRAAAVDPMVTLRAEN